MRPPFARVRPAPAIRRGAFRGCLLPVAIYVLSSGGGAWSAASTLPAMPVSDLLPDFTRWLSDPHRRQTPGPAGADLAGFLRRDRPDIYGRSPLFAMDAPSLDRYLADVRRYLPAMRSIAARCQAEQPRVTRALQQWFPDYDPTRVRVSLMLSLFRFDAKVPHDQPDELWLGLDGIAKLHGPDCKVGVLLAHENFHLYHFQVNPQPNRGESVPLYRQVWQEGLACYVSHLLNPNASLADVLLDSDLAENGPPHVPAVARAMLDDLSADDDAVTARYLGFHHHPAGTTPARMGYLIGYDVVAGCAMQRPLAELVRLRGNALRRTMERGLVALARNRAN